MGAYRYGKKKTIKEKASDSLRTAFTAVALGGVAAVPAYYNYGTIHTETLKVTGYDQHYKWDDKANESKYTYEIKTNKGSLWDTNSFLHAKFKGQTDQIWETVQSDKTYDIKYYGWDFAFFKRNILSLNEVSAEELKARAQAQKQAQQQGRPQGQQPARPANAAQPQPGAQPVAGQPVASAAAGALSGRMIVQDLVTADGKSSVQVTIPVEAIGKVTINSVVNIQPAAPAPVAAPAPRPPGA